MVGAGESAHTLSSFEELPLGSAVTVVPLKEELTPLIRPQSALIGEITDLYDPGGTKRGSPFLGWANQPSEFPGTVSVLT